MASTPAIIGYAAGFLILIALGVSVLWNLGVFNVGGGGFYGNRVVTGFGVMQPIAGSIEYKNRSFITQFRNTLNNPIRIKNITLNELIAESRCSAGDSDNPFPADYIDAGSTFNVSATCPVKEDGESYDLEINIQYSVLDGGKETRYSDNGRIKGQGEHYTDY